MYNSRYAQPEVRVVNISHKKVVEENRQIPVMDERTMTTSQQTSTQHTTHQSNPQPGQVKVSVVVHLCQIIL